MLEYCYARILLYYINSKKYVKIRKKTIYCLNLIGKVAFIATSNATISSKYTI